MKPISFCINTAKNEKQYIELLFKSLKQNLSNNFHEILIFVDSDNQNTIEFLLQQKQHFPNLQIWKNNLPVSIGYQSNINFLFKKAKNDKVSYIQSDMVIGPGYDIELLKTFGKFDKKHIISSTRIEPPLHPPSPEKYTFNFGLNPDEFLLNFDKFNEFVLRNKDDNKITRYYFAPFSLYKTEWESIGGHDSLFRRSREDSDVLYRLLFNNNKIVQCWNAMCYHFTCTTSRGIDWWKAENQKATLLQQKADEAEIKKFIRKWGRFRHPTSLEEIQSDFKYNISFNVTLDSEDNKENVLNFLVNNYFLFQKIYINDNQLQNLCKNALDKQYDYPNELLGNKKEDWNNYKKYLNTIDSEKIFVSQHINDDDIVVDIKSSILFDKAELLFRLQELIHTSIEDDDVGEYDWDDMLIKVNRKRNAIRDNIYCHNPNIDDCVIKLL